MTAERIHAPQFQLYKESTIPWAPVIPNHWETKRAKSLFKKMERPVRESDEVVTCFRDGTVTLRRNRRESGFTESLKEIGYQGIRPGDLVIHAMDAFAGAIGVSDSAGKGTPVYSVCTPIGEANPLYYAHALQEMSRNKWIESLAKGIRERSSDFRFTEFSAQVVPVPPPEEQAAIVRFLDHADEQIQRYIASKERLIALLEEERQALVHQAVTRGLDPNVRLKPSGMEWLGDVPEHWEVARFARQVNIAEGQADPKIEPYSSMLMIAPNHVESGTGRLLSRETAYEQGAISGKYFCRAGDVVYSKIRPALAKVLVAPTDCLCSADMYPLRPRNSLQRDYLFWLLLSTGFTAWSVLQSDRVAMPKINRQALNNVHIPLPPLSEQVSIVRHLIEATAKASGAIDRARHQIELMEEYRTRLIADVVTGKIDVREAKP